MASIKRPGNNVRLFTAPVAVLRPDGAGPGPAPRWPRQPRLSPVYVLSITKGSELHIFTPSRRCPRRFTVVKYSGRPIGRVSAAIQCVQRDL